MEPLDVQGVFHHDVDGPHELVAASNTRGLHGATTALHHFWGLLTIRAQRGAVNALENFQCVMSFHWPAAAFASPALQSYGILINSSNVPVSHSNILVNKSNGMIVVVLDCTE